ncbi:MAG: hypothetical protein WBA10_21445 [Elainellaceae cyanobacterium]
MTYLVLPKACLGTNARWSDSPSQPVERSGEHRLSEFIASDSSNPLLSESLNPPICPSEPAFHTLQFLALGHPYAVDNCRLRLHKLGYAVRAAFPKEAPNDWSLPLPIIRSTEVVRAARPGDIMRILTKRIAKP